MFKARWQLMRVFGIPINIDASWLIILVLLTWTFASGVLPQALPDYSRQDYLVMALVTVLAFFGCIVLHELGHALVAKRLGIRIRGITLFLFGGVAELEEEPPSASKEFFMAIGGPVVSVVLAGLFYVLSVVGDQLGWPAPPVFVLLYLAGINLTVLIFNMVPAFPLDGGRVLRSILWAVTGDLRRATFVASLFGRGFAWILFLLAVLMLVNGDIFSGIWLGLIGMFLNQAATGSYQQVVIRQSLQGEPLHRFMNPEPITVAPALDLQSWVDDYIYRFYHKTYPVVDDGVPVGVVHTSDLARIPRDEWGRHTIAEIMQRDLEGCCIGPDADALEALEQMQRTSRSRLLVRDQGRLVGIVSLKDLMRLLDLKLSLGGGKTDQRPAPSGRARGEDQMVALGRNENTR